MQKYINTDTKSLLTYAGFTLLGVGLHHLISKKCCKSKCSSDDDCSKTGTSDGKITNLNVCVTGAAGQIAYSFIPLVARGDVFGHNAHIDLRLLDINDEKVLKRLKGIELELEDLASPYLTKVSSGHDAEELFKDCDVVVFIGGFPRKDGMERKDLLKMNGGIFSVQGKALDKVAKKSVRCLVVANPANTNCLILQKNAPSIHTSQFTCLTRLDQNRAYAQIAKKIQKPITSLGNIIIWGNHSKTQYPDVQHCTVEGKKVTDVLKDNKFFDVELVKSVQDRGGEILKVAGGTSVFSAAAAVRDHMRDWYLGSNGRTVAMGLVTDGKQYNVPAGLVFSFPIKCTGNWAYEIVQGLEPTSSLGQTKIKITTDELVDERVDAFPEEFKREEPKKEEPKKEVTNPEPSKEGSNKDETVKTDEKKPEETNSEPKA